MARFHAIAAEYLRKTEQASQTSAIATAMKEMVATIAENTQQAARAAKEASQVSQEARKSGEIIQAIEEIADQQSARATANIERMAVSLQHQAASLQELVGHFVIRTYNDSTPSYHTKSPNQSAIYLSLNSQTVNSRTTNEEQSKPYNAFTGIVRLSCFSGEENRCRFKRYHKTSINSLKIYLHSIFYFLLAFLQKKLTYLHPYLFSHLLA